VSPDSVGSVPGGDSVPAGDAPARLPCLQVQQRSLLRPDEGHGEGLLDHRDQPTHVLAPGHSRTKPEEQVPSAGVIN
jgi:hypothetical protein